MWTARLAMIAVFSTPLMVAWAEFGGGAPPRVRSYRLFLTVAAMVFMGALVFVKQHCMDRELLHLLRLSRAESRRNVQTERRVGEQGTVAAVAQSGTAAQES